MTSYTAFKPFKPRIDCITFIYAGAEPCIDEGRGRFNLGISWQMTATAKFEHSRGLLGLSWPADGDEENKHREFRLAVARAVKEGVVLIVPHRDILTDEEYRIAEAAGVRVVSAEGPKLVYSH